MARNKSNYVDWIEAPDIKKRVLYIVKSSGFIWIDTNRLFFMRSSNSSSRARARIWGLPRVWQLALNIKPCYIIEVLSKHFDHLEKSQQDDVLLHELAHIPHNFSGSLVPHIRKRGKRNFYDKVSGLIKIYKQKI